MILALVAILFVAVVALVCAIFICDFTRSPNLAVLPEFDSECVSAFALARRFASYKQRVDTDPVDLLYGILCSGLPECVKFTVHTGLDSRNVVHVISAPDGSSARSEGVGISFVLKKILAHAHGEARKDKCANVAIYHLVYGMIRERPRDVGEVLEAAGKNWSDLKKYEKGA